MRFCRRPVFANLARRTSFAMQTVPFHLKSILAAVVLATVVFCLAFVDSGRSYELPLLLLALNTVFSLLTSMVVSIQFARAFVGRGNMSFLLLACASCVLGISGVSGAIIGLLSAAGHFDANTLVTIHNTGVWISAIFHLVAVIVYSLINRLVDKHRLYFVAIGYAATLALVASIVVLVGYGLLPVFFIAGQGGTIARQFVVGSSIAMFVLTAILLFSRPEGRQISLGSWYGTGLLLMAVGLFAILLQKNNGSLVCWYGRGIQYLGGLAMLAAAWQTWTAGEDPEITADSSLNSLESAPLIVVAAIAIVGVSVTGALQFLVVTPDDPKFTYLTFLPAVMFSLLLGGNMAGVASMLLSILLVAFFHFDSTLHHHTLHGDLLNLSIFVGVGCCIAWLAKALQRTRADLISATHELAYANQSRQNALILKESENRLKSVIEGTNAGLWDWNIETGETVFNERWAQIIGYSLEEISPCSIATWERFTNPEDLQRSNDLLYQVFSGDRELYDCDYRMRHRDGHWVWIHSRGKVVEWSAEGKPLRMSGSHTDISDRKHLEERLKDVVDEQQAILATVPLCIAKTVDSRPVWLNCENVQYAEKILGIKNISAHDTSLFSPAGGVLDMQHQALPVLRDGKIFRVERDIRDDDRNVSTILVTAKAIDSADLGRGVIWTFEDNSQRKAIEAQLQESERNFRSIVEATSDLIVVCSEQGDILFVNSNFSRKLGFTDDELSKMSILDLHPPPLRLEAAGIVAAMLKGERELCPLPILSKEGLTIPVETRAWRGTWSGHNSIFGFIRDLTKDLEERQMFEALFRHNPAVMAITSFPDRNFLDVNDAFLKTLGYELHEVAGRSPDDLDLFVDKKEERDSATELLNSTRIADRLHQVRHKNGSIVDGLFSGEIIASQGKTFAVSVMIDLTARLHMEKDLLAAKEKAENADAEKSKLLSVIAHEFRTPLALLNSSIDILDRYTEKLTLEERLVQKKHIRSALLQLTSLVDVSQCYNWLRSDKRPTRLSEIDLCAHCSDLASEVRCAWAEGQTLKVNVPATPIMILSDIVLLRSILTNLLANAFQYTPAGGTITLCVRKIGDRIKIVVEDTGKGIPFADIDTVFQPFSRGGNVTTQRGMGLGLNIVAIALEKLNGTIDLQSREGVGTTISLDIPSFSVQSSSMI